METYNAKIGIYTSTISCFCSVHVTSTSISERTVKGTAAISAKYSHCGIGGVCPNGAIHNPRLSPSRK